MLENVHDGVYHTPHVLRGGVKKNYEKSLFDENDFRQSKWVRWHNNWTNCRSFLKPNK